MCEALKHKFLMLLFLINGWLHLCSEVNFIICYHGYFGSEITMENNQPKTQWYWHKIGINWLQNLSVFWWCQHFLMVTSCQKNMFLSVNKKEGDVHGILEEYFMSLMFFASHHIRLRDCMYYKFKHNAVDYNL